MNRLAFLLILLFSPYASADRFWDEVVPAWQQNFESMQSMQCQVRAANGGVIGCYFKNDKVRFDVGSLQHVGTNGKYHYATSDGNISDIDSKPILKNNYLSGPVMAASHLCMVKGGSIYLAELDRNANVTMSAIGDGLHVIDYSPKDSKFPTTYRITVDESRSWAPTHWVQENAVSKTVGTVEYYDDTIYARHVKSVATGQALQGKIEWFLDRPQPCALADSEFDIEALGVEPPAEYARPKPHKMAWAALSIVLAAVVVLGAYKRFGVAVFALLLVAGCQSPTQSISIELGNTREVKIECKVAGRLIGHDSGCSCPRLVDEVPQTVEQGQLLTFEATPRQPGRREYIVRLFLEGEPVQFSRVVVEATGELSELPLEPTPAEPS